MNVYDFLEDVNPDAQRAVALGLFDGVHLGHQSVIGRALEYRRENLKTAVFTYRIQHIVPERKSSAMWIATEEDRCIQLEKMGVDDVVQPTFEAFRDMSPEEFVVDFLIKRMNAKVLCCGEDFRFGKKAAGNVELLKQLCSEHNVKVEIVPPVDLDGGRISSTRIREYVRAGNMEMAWKMMGRPYTLYFPVVSGNKIGRTLEFPTINQVYPEHFSVPRYGVYVSVAEIDGVFYPSVSNVGVKPTIGSDKPLSETYIIGYEGDLYGRCIHVSLCHYIRPEMKFDSLDALKAQIGRDKQLAELMGPAFVTRMKG